MGRQIIFPVAFILLLLLLGAKTLQAQPPIQWAKCYGTADKEEAFSIDRAWGGGYVITGSRMNCQHGDRDIWIVKTDDMGNEVWSKCYGGSGSEVSYSIHRVKSESDSGYIVAGQTVSADGQVTGPHGMTDGWVIKTDASGNLQWQKALGGSANDIAWAAKQSKDGGFIVVSETGSNDGDVSGNHGLRDIWIVKLDKTGSIQWKKTLGGTLDEYPTSMDVTSDGGFVVAGSATSSDGDVSNNLGMSDYWIVKLDSAGTIQWEKNYGGFGSDYATSISQTTDSGFILSGQSTYNPEGNGQYHSIIRIDKNGSIQMSARPNRSLDVMQSSTGMYGAVYGSTGGYVVNKLDTSGTSLWTKTMGGSQGAFPGSIVEAPDGGYVVAGHTHSTDGDVTGNHGMSDFWVVKMAPEPNSVSPIMRSNSNISWHPNPAREEVRFSERVNVRVMNIAGQVLLDRQATIILDVTSFPSGMYLLTFYNVHGEIIQTEKMIKE